MCYDNKQKNTKILEKHNPNGLTHKNTFYLRVLVTNDLTWGIYFLMSIKIQKKFYFYFGKAI